MNHLMAQNAGIGYPNMINYPLNMQLARPIDPSNPIQYSFQQSQAQRFIYPYILNQGIQNPNPINLPLQNMQNIQNIQINNVVLDNSATKADTNNPNGTQNNSSNSTLPPSQIVN